MTNSSLTALPIWPTGQMITPGCISPGWRSCFMSSRRVMPHTVSNPNDWHSKLWVATWRMTSQNLATTTSTSLPISCSRKSFGPLRRKTSVDSSLTRIKLGSPWMKPIRSSTQKTAWKWTKGHPLNHPWFTLFLRNKILSHRILRLPHSGCNKGSRSLATTNKTSTIAEIDPGAKISWGETSITGHLIKIKEAPMLQEMVNSVFTAK